MSAILVTVICVFNVIMWIVFLIRFKKLFTTDDVIEKTRKILNQMITDINRNTERNISLLDDRTAKLKEAVSDADHRLQLLQTETVKKTAESVFNAQLESLKAELGSAKKVVSKTTSTADIKAAAKMYEVSHQGKTALAKSEEPVQKDLFSAQEKNPAQQTPPDVPVTSVPLVANVYLADNPVTPPKDFNKEVYALYMQGFPVDQIAQKLSCSISEVQFSLTFTKGKK